MSRRRKTAGEQLSISQDPTYGQIPEIEVVDADLPEPDTIVEGGDPEQEELEVERAETRPEVPEGTPTPYEVLKKQFEERETELRIAREHRQAAEQRASEMSSTAAKHARDYHEAATAALDNALELSRSNITQAEAAMQTAAAAQDWAAFSKAQTVIAENTGRRMQLEQARQQLEAGPPKVDAYKPQDPIEQRISQFSPRSQDWLRQHKDDIFGDEERVLDAQAAHRLAVRRGITPDTDAYFSILDEHMGYAMSTQQSARPPARAAPAAPPARTTFGQPAGRGTVRVPLSAAEKATAHAIYSDRPPAEAEALYAKGKSGINRGDSNLMWSANKYKGGAGV
jgi:hypothetical protein